MDKVVPDEWKDRWQKAVRSGWIEQDVGGGITELRKFIETHVATNEPRRLRTWVMFDSDGDAPTKPSRDAEDIRNACQEWLIAHHLLYRRAIENYIPNETLDEWVSRQTAAQRAQAAAAVRTYARLGPNARHFYNLKKWISTDLAPHIWGYDSASKPYETLEPALASETFEGERSAIFQSIFAML